MDLIAHFKKTLEDDHFSKSEKNEIKIILENEPLDPERLSFIRTKIYELANQKATLAPTRRGKEKRENKDAYCVLQLA